MPRVSKKEPEPPVVTDEAKSLDEIALDTGITHTLKKDSEGLLKDLKKEFFDAATLKSSTSQLAQKTVAVPTSVSDSGGDTAAYALKYNPGWEVVEQRVMPNGSFRVIIREDPAFKPFSYVVRLDEPEKDEDGKVVRLGYKVQRSVVSGSVLVDDERLKIEKPHLWREITSFAGLDTFNQMAAFFGIEDLSRVEKYLDSTDAPRQLRPLSELTDEQQKAIKPYMYEGPKTLKLLVNDAKESDLAGL